MCVHKKKKKNIPKENVFLSNKDIQNVQPCEKESYFGNILKVVINLCDLTGYENIIYLYLCNLTEH